MDSVPKSPYSDAFFVSCRERVEQGGQEDVGSSEPVQQSTILVMGRHETWPAYLSIVPIMPTYLLGTCFSTVS